MAQGVAPRVSSVWEVFRIFLWLGVSSFGGPIAHLGYFRAELVNRRGWLNDKQYSDLVALCQFLPGPASSQVGFALGLHRAGFLGAIAAFVGFTMPSAVLLVLFAYGVSAFSGVIAQGAVDGLKIVAVAIVAQAVLGMAKSLTPDKVRALIAVVAIGCALLISGPFGQVLAIVVGGVAGFVWCRSADGSVGSVVSFGVRRRVGALCLVLFAGLLVLGPVVSRGAVPGVVALFETFFGAGSLVFGGGHVVLPLLQSGVVESGWVSINDFLAGYGAAQAVPGPLFTFAGFLGALSSAGSGGVGGAAIALVAVFLPGFLLLVGVLPFWSGLAERAWMQAVMRGANAAVVGVLAAALYSPVFSSSVTDPRSFVLAVACFVFLVVWKFPPWVVVLVGAGVGCAVAVLA